MPVGVIAPTTFDFSPRRARARARGTRSIARRWLLELLLECLDDFLESRLGIAHGRQLDPSVLPHDEVSGNVLLGVLAVDLPLGVGRHGKGELLLLRELLKLFGAVLPADHDQLEVLAVAVFFHDFLFEVRQFRQTRSAPRCEEVDQNDRSLLLAEGEFFPGNRLAGEVRSLFSGLDQRRFRLVVGDWGLLCPSHWQREDECQPGERTQSDRSHC